MPETLHPSILTVGLFDCCFRQRDASITHGQTLPLTLAYVDEPIASAPIDIVLATSGSESRLLERFPEHPRKVLWLQENHELLAHPPASMMVRYDLVITNDCQLLAALPQARYLPLVGTWLDTAMSKAVKTDSVSMISDVKKYTSGHRLRHDIASQIPTGSETYDGYGRLFGQRYMPSKLPALGPYRFSIVVEPACYEAFYSEKICDAFAAKTVPIYWGPPLGRLSALGFDVSGILPFATLSGLRERLDVIARHGEEMYADITSAIAANHARICEIPSTEHLLEPLLREHFDLR